VNKQISYSLAIHFNSIISLFSSNMEIDISVDSILRGGSNLPSKSSPSSSLISSSASSISYYEYMKVDDNKPNNDSREPIHSF